MHVRKRECGWYIHTWVWIYVYRIQRTSDVMLDHALLYSPETGSLVEPEASLEARGTQLS